MEKIPMLDLGRQYRYMEREVRAAIMRCLDHQKWILGPEVAELEGRIAAYLGVSHCIGCSSGTDALVLSLRAMAINVKGKEYFEREDEIITTAFTFTATGDAILRAGATPVFVDIDRSTFNINPAEIEGYMGRNGKRVVGILPVHLYGRPCNMDRIKEVADRYGLFVVEDVAQAFGATWRARRLGSLGNAGAFSFFPSKNLGGFGDGGMVATDDEETAQTVRMLLKHGGRDKYNVEHVGYNARLDTIQAAILLAKLKYVEDFNQRRRRIAGIYSSTLSGLPGIVPPEENGKDDEVRDGEHVYHQYTVRVPGGAREQLKKYLDSCGVSTMVYYPVPLHEMAAFRQRSRASGDLHETESAAREVLSLPIEPLFQEDEIAYTMRCVRGFCADQGALIASEPVAAAATGGYSGKRIAAEAEPVLLGTA